MSNRTDIMIDPGKLPVFSVAQAINLAYTEAVVRLSNALNLGEFPALRNFNYRMYITNPTTSEARVVVQRGGEGDTDPVNLPFDVTISILTIIRLKDYMASYGQSRQISVFLSGQGDWDTMSDMDRLLVLFEERPEFEMYALSNPITETRDKR